jgi:MFS family permease
MPELAVRFLWWSLVRSSLARGWWLVTAVYLVVEAELEPFQLVFIGTAQSAVVVLAEVPAGVLADTVSRRFAVVVAAVVSGTGMAMTGFVSDFPLLVVSNCLWGLGWAFTSGADVAWITDELERPDVIDRVLARRARYELWGAALGLPAFGALAWATDLATAIVVAGAGMVVLGGVIARFPETRFTPTRTARWTTSFGVFRGGVALARRDRQLLVVILSVFLVNGAEVAYGRLFEQRLLDLDFATGAQPIVWFTALGMLCFGIGIVALHVVEARIDGVLVARRAYAAACFVGAAGMLVLAHAPDAVTAVGAVLFVNGLARPLVRPMADIWVNRRATTEVRATIHSFSSQAENLGEATFGITLTVLAGLSTTVALTGSVVATALAGVLVARAAVDAQPVLGVSE